MAEELIAQQMAAPSPDDQELACLLIYLSRSLTGLHEYEAACEKADIAAFLAHKLKVEGLLEEALYRAGSSYVRAGEYRTAVKRFTTCTTGNANVFRVEVLYNRALAYTNLGSYAQATLDYEAALQAEAERRPQMSRLCRINLAWVLILQQEFERAEALLAEFAAQDSDQAVQLQIAHDRAHISFLKGDNLNAFCLALVALRQAGGDYPHIRAHIVLTLMALATSEDLPQQAFTLGVFAKRLAGVARRPDLDDEASWQMQELECQAGTEHLARSLQEVREILPGTLQRPKATQGGQRTRGVG